MMSDRSERHIRGVSTAARAPGLSDPRGAQTAGRALDALMAIAQSSHPLTINEVAERASLSRSAAYRVLRELETRGFVGREPDGRRYVVGARAFELAATVMERNDMRRVARPLMIAIMERTLETVVLCLKNGRYRTSIDVVEGAHPVRRVIPLGETIPLFEGPAGKTILAYLPQEEALEVIAWAQTEGADGQHIQRLLEEIRRDGYAALVGDRTPGVAGLAVPIFGAAGVVGALTISGPSERWSLTRMQEERAFVVDCSHAISASLGAPPSAETQTAGAHADVSAR